MSEVELLISAWNEELIDIKQKLFTKGAEADSYEYSLLSTEALRLSMCLNELQIAEGCDRAGVEVSSNELIGRAILERAA